MSSPRSFEASVARVEARRAGRVDAEADAVELLGLLASASGDREEAVNRYRDLVAMRAAQGTELGIVSRMRLGGICHDLYRLDEAVAHLELVVTDARRADDRRAELDATTLLAATHVELWVEAPNDALAERALATILLGQDLARAANDLGSLAYLDVCRGWMTELRGDAAASAAHYERALQVGGLTGRAASIGALAAASLATTAKLGAAETAELLTRARTAAGELQLPNVRPSIELRAWMLRRRSGDTPTDGVFARLAQIEPSSLQSETRMTLACVRTSMPRSGALDLEIEPDGSSFTIDGQRVDLTTKPALRRVLAVLAAADRAKGISWPEVFERAWPGERVTGDSSFQRVRTAVWSLRKLGLRDAIQRTPEGGYVLAVD